MKNCPASQGDEPQRGGGGLTPTRTTPDASTDNINGLEKGEKSLLCMGNPSGPAGHLPCKAEEFCLRTDKLFAAMALKSVAAYQRGSMKPFFPTDFRLRLCLCGRETPPSLRATSPTRRRSLFCYTLGKRGQNPTRQTEKAAHALQRGGLPISNTY